MPFTRLQHALLLTLYEQQRAYTLGRWSFDSTVWSKTTYLLAKERGQLRPSPAPGRHNLTRDFDQMLHRAAKKLIRLGLCDWRNVRPPEPVGRGLQGYKRHKVRDRDLLLTTAGLEAAEAIFCAEGLMATDSEARCDAALPPDGPLPTALGGCDD